MKILFFIPPAHGHVNPTLPVAYELVNRGEEVVYYLTDEFKTRVQRTGAVFRQVDNTFDVSKQITKMQAYSRVGEVASFEDVLSCIAQNMNDNLPRIPELLDRVRMENADCIIYDPICLWGNALAKILNIPAVTFCVSWVISKDSSMRPQMDRLTNLKMMPVMLKLLWTKWKLQIRHRFRIPMLHPSEGFTAAEDLNIVSLPRQLQPDAENFDDRYVFIGSSILPNIVDYDVEFPFEQLDDRPILYISLGTSFFDLPDFFKTCIDAFANTRWLVVMATWKDLGLSNLPSNFIVNSLVPQLQLLKRTSLYITHGGTGSVMGSLWYGIPLVIVPQMPEQFLTANLVTESGLGITIPPPDVNTETLCYAVNTVDTPAYRKRLLEMQIAIQKEGGYHRAADEIQNWLYSSTQNGSKSQTKDEWN